MDDNIVSNELNINRNIKDEKQEKVLNIHKPKNIFKEKECDVMAYNKKEKTLDIKFDNFGIRLKNVDKFQGNKVFIKYKGEIGKPNFIYKL